MHASRDALMAGLRCLGFTYCGRTKRIIRGILVKTDHEMEDTNLATFNICTLDLHLFKDKFLHTSSSQEMQLPWICIS